MGSEVVNTLSKFYDNKYNDIIPFIDYTQYTYGTIYDRSTTGGYGMIYFKSSDGAAILSNFREELVGIGWDLVEEVDDEYRYRIARDDVGYYHIGVKSLGEYCYIYLYENGDLAGFLNRKFGSSINSTVTIDEVQTIYNYDSSSGEKGDAYSTRESTTLYQFKDDEVLKTTNYGTLNASQSYFTGYDDGTFYIYNLTSSNEWVVNNSYESTAGYTIATYDRYGTYNPMMLADFANYLTYRDESDAIYDVPTDLVSTVATAIFGAGSYGLGLSTNKTAQLEIDFYTLSSTFTISCEYEYVSGSYIYEYQYTATYSRMGNTTISLSSYPTRPTE